MHPQYRLCRQGVQVNPFAPGWILVSLGTGGLEPFSLPMHGDVVPLQQQAQLDSGPMRRARRGAVGLRQTRLQGEVTLASAVAASAADAPAGGQSFRSPGYRFYVLLLLTFGYTLNFIDRNLLNVIQTPLPVG